MSDEFTFGVLGAGNMACAIVEGALEAGALTPGQVVASRRDQDALRAWTERTGTRLEVHNERLAADSDWLLVGLKPQITLEVLREIRVALRPTTVVISLAAGLDTASLEGALAPAQPVIRLMPNTPCLVGRGATGLCLGTHATEDQASWVTGLLRSVGQVLRLEESLMDTVTAVSGSGPAYVFYLMESLENAAVSGGLDRESARSLVSQTILGAAELARASDVEPKVLRARVTSPKGTTEAAIEVLDADGVAQSFERAVAAGIARGAELREPAS